MFSTRVTTADRIINPHPHYWGNPLFGHPTLLILSEFLASPVEFPQIFIEF
jgi:hypothetical protein